MICEIIMSILMCVADATPAPVAEAEEHRTQIMAVDRDLSELLASVTGGGAPHERALSRLVRHGRMKLVSVPGDSLLFVNARDLALGQMLIEPPEEDENAREFLDGEIMGSESLERLVSRYPRSKAAMDAVRRALGSPLGDAVRREWGALIRARSLEADRKSPPSPVPACVAGNPGAVFPLKATWKLLVSGPAFRPVRFEGLQRGIYVEPLYPLTHLQWADGLFMGDPRGFKQVLFDGDLSQRVSATPERFLNHLDNNIVGDFLLNKGWAFAPLRSSPMIRDSQKDLYYVELSRHKIGAFKLGEGLESKAEEPSQQRWNPVWCLEDASLSYNATPAVAGPWLLAAGSSLVGLFNVELTCVEKDTGKPLWKEPLASGQQELNYFGRHVRECLPGVPLVSGDRVWISSNLGSLHCLDLGGRPLWARFYTRCPTPEPRQYYAHVDPRLTRFRNQPPVMEGGRLIAGPVDSPNLLCVDALTGKLLWTFSPFQPNEPPSNFWAKVYWEVLDEGILVTDMHHMTLLNSKDGSVIRRVQFSKRFINRPGRPLVCRNAVVLASDGVLMVFSRPTLDFLHKVDLSKHATFEGVNMAFDGKRLALVDGRLNSPDFFGDFPDHPLRPGSLWVLEAQQP